MSHTHYLYLSACSVSERGVTCTTSLSICEMAVRTQTMEEGGNVSGGRSRVVILMLHFISLLLDFLHLDSHCVELVPVL